MIREIVRIDEEKCDGCGLCVPSCHEGAIRIENGKARLVSDRLCDGLGACLGHCPQGAITIEMRDAPAFDEELVHRHLRGDAPLEGRRHAPARSNTPAHSNRPAASAAHAGGGCPGSRMMQFGRAAGAAAPHAGDDLSCTPSELSHWPVQLNLLPPQAPVLRDARLLIAADCVPVAFADFQQRLLRGRAVLIGCPKFDDLMTYVERLTAMIQINNLQEVVVARMEVPCCMGILSAVLEARKRAGVNVRVVDVVIGTHGDWLAEREIRLAQEQ